jgi:flagellin-specific chaperone FliS
MKILKSAVIAFSLAAAMGSFSTAAVAEAGRTTYKPIDAIQGVLERIAAAETAINNGAEDAAVAALIKKASDFSEEINANDKVARENSKALKHLKAAIAAAKSANLQEAREHLANAKTVIEGLKKLL